MAPKNNLACNAAIVFADIHVKEHEKIVEVIGKPVEIVSPKIHKTLLGEILEPSTAKVIFFGTPVHI